MIRCRFDFDWQVAMRLRATGGPFTTGSGPLVTGRTLALVMAMTGRPVYCDELD